jgi:hypothetical protein
VVHSTCRAHRAPAHRGLDGTPDAPILIMSAVLFLLLLAISPVFAVLDAFGTQTATAPPPCGDISGTVDPVVRGGPGGDSTVEHRDPHAAAQMLGPVLVCARPS